MASKLFLAIKLTVCTNALEIHGREGFQKQDFWMM